MALSRRAVGQVEQGADPDQVAQVLGMTRTAVDAWLARYREGGGRRSGSPLPGRPPRLSGAQVARLYGLVVPASCGSGLRKLAYRRLRLWFLPGYSAELNPGEWLWKHVKHVSTCSHSPW